jgi:hypothetical protein
MAASYLRFRPTPPAQGKHNALQKSAYSCIVALGAVATLTGFAIYKLMQLQLLTILFGGFQLTRSWHFVSMWPFVGFPIVHVIMVILPDALERISRFNDTIGQALFSGNTLAAEYPVTAQSSRAPTYWTAATMPVLNDPAAYRLSGGGLVERPTLFSLEMLRAVHPSICVGYVRFDSFDAGYVNGWDLAGCLHPQTILAYAWNDRLLGPERGAPVRLYSPVKRGYKLTKYVTAVTFSA